MRGKKTMLCAAGLLLLAVGCANGGRLPSLTLRATSIWRDRLQEERYRRSFELRTDARMGWRLEAMARARSEEQEGPSQQKSEQLGQEPCDNAALCAWQTREQSLALRIAADEEYR